MTSILTGIYIFEIASFSLFLIQLSLIKKILQEIKEILKEKNFNEN